MKVVTENTDSSYLDLIEKIKAEIGRLQQHKRPEKRYTKKNNHVSTT